MEVVDWEFGIEKKKKEKENIGPSPLASYPPASAFATIL